MFEFIGVVAVIVIIGAGLYYLKHKAAVKAAAGAASQALKDSQNKVAK